MVVNKGKLKVNACRKTGELPRIYTGEIPGCELGKRRFAGEAEFLNIVVLNHLQKKYYEPTNSNVNPNRRYIRPSSCNAILLF